MAEFIFPKVLRKELKKKLQLGRICPEKVIKGLIIGWSILLFYK